MKLLMITSLKEYQQNVANIFRQSGIKVFSVTDTVGFKDNGFQNIMEGWYAGGIGHYDSIFLFSFTENEKASHAMSLVKEFNTSQDGSFPIRAFIIPVESSSY